MGPTTPIPRMPTSINGAAVCVELVLELEHDAMASSMPITVKLSDMKNMKPSCAMNSFDIPKSPFYVGVWMIRNKRVAE